MLKRTRLRRSLDALLWSDQVPQGLGCQLGPIWTNCDGQKIEIQDHATHQIMENAEASYNLRAKDALIIFGFESVNYDFMISSFERVDFKVNIDIVVNAPVGRQRQEMLDIIEERIFYRFMSQKTFIDTLTGEKIRPFTTSVIGNKIQIDARDDSSFGGDYTVRRLGLSFSTHECLKAPGCDDTPLCFDLDRITVLSGDCIP